jgi:hypothetical protein
MLLFPFPLGHDDIAPIPFLGSYRSLTNRYKNGNVPWVNNIFPKHFRIANNSHFFCMKVNNFLVINRKFSGLPFIIK